MLASGKNGTLYIGVTNDLVRRIYEHRTASVDGFAKQHDVRTLVYFEISQDPNSAITRERKLKRRRRAWKIALIERDNPEWRDLYQDIA
jgi:putative endonuclease